ncbi:uncharacterized protein EI97DRAFT_243409 [Westerdykella ornata]|uniref:Magnesium transport protein CorA, transmembrane region n=1 Tax=Westerdykella ornata TaxID=318751 RepID=A0A6A6J5U1_WESOR|nr:uncharacterized protein EI97DRAFT_243409 [Westerdykella ornata]KAF2271805.1 hypothetical protein EI97DRAFT_243409 [Westerdykella ornata]
MKTLSFIDSTNAPGPWALANFAIRSTTLSILQKAGLSSLLMSNIYSSEEFWAKMGNQRFLHRGDKGQLASFGMCYRYLCGWDVGVSFTQFIRTRGEVTYFCINYPSRAREKLEAYLRQHPSYAYREFFIDAVAANDCFKGWQLVVGERRESLLYLERKYAGDTNIDFNLATRQLHDLSKDWYTLEQDIWAYNSQIRFLKESLDIYLSKLSDPSVDWMVDKFSTTGESFEVLQSQAESLSRWITVYRERTAVQINLLFNLASQRESHTSTEIAQSTAKVAEQTQRDSSSMITIAAVTMAFLPGTFICAILSTTFFDFGVDGLSVSRQWWILPATTIPLMIVVFAVWLGWQHLRFANVRDEHTGKPEKYAAANSATGEYNA